MKYAVSRPICVGAIVWPEGMRMNDGVKQTAMCLRMRSHGLEGREVSASDSARRGAGARAALFDHGEDGLDVAAPR